MSTTEPHLQRARTKIVATVGPVSADLATLTDLVERGVDVFRLNMAHGDREEHQRAIENIRQLSLQHGRPIGILVDLAGPKIRLGQLSADVVDCHRGDAFRFVAEERSNDVCELTSNYSSLVDELSEGDLVMLADGQVSMRVTCKEPGVVHCIVVQSGAIRSRQGINLPGVKLGVKAITEKDRDNAVWAAENKVDFISLSFVRSAEEIQRLKQLISNEGSTAMVIAKIEKPEALEVLEEIVDAADGIMVARGDLGVEIDVAQTPMVQKRIVRVCQQYSKPVIVATQMLDSMHRSTQPTRAEVTDIANAILDGADACMLSGETAIGEYPRESVEMMNRIMLETEKEMNETNMQALGPTHTVAVHPVTRAVVFGAAKIATQLAAKLVVIATHTGKTARIKAKQRDVIPAVGISDSEQTLCQLTLLWGIIPLRGVPLGEETDIRQAIEAWGLADGCLQSGDRVVFVVGTGLAPLAHNVVSVHEVP
ncbi:MAG: pyruvate kinase [Pirellulaceae bacterium]